jgi:hypothetical protein
VIREALDGLNERRDALIESVKARYPEALENTNLKNPTDEDLLRIKKALDSYGGYEDGLDKQWEEIKRHNEVEQRIREEGKQLKTAWADEDSREAATPFTMDGIDIIESFFGHGSKPSTPDSVRQWNDLVPLLKRYAANGPALQELKAQRGEEQTVPAAEPTRQPTGNAGLDAAFERLRQDLQGERKRFIPNRTEEELQNLVRINVSNGRDPYEGLLDPDQTGLSGDGVAAKEPKLDPNERVDFGEILDILFGGEPEESDRPTLGSVVELLPDERKEEEPGEGRKRETPKPGNETRPSVERPKSPETTTTKSTKAPAGNKSAVKASNGLVRDHHDIPVGRFEISQDEATGKLKVAIRKRDSSNTAIEISAEERKGKELRLEDGGGAAGIKTRWMLDLGRAPYRMTMTELFIPETQAWMTTAEFAAKFGLPTDAPLFLCPGEDVQDRRVLLEEGTLVVTEKNVKGGTIPMATQTFNVNFRRGASYDVELTSTEDVTMGFVGPGGVGLDGMSGRRPVKRTLVGELAGDMNTGFYTKEHEAYPLKVRLLWEGARAHFRIEVWERWNLSSPSK